MWRMLMRGTGLMGSHSFTCHPHVPYPRGQSHTWYYYILLVVEDGLPWWSPSQVLTTILCVQCTCVYVRVYCFVRYLMSRPILVTSYYFSPVITADITSHSNFLKCHTDHFTSLCAGDHLQSSTAVTHCFTSCYSIYRPWKDESLSRARLLRALNLGPPVWHARVNKRRSS